MIIYKHSPWDGFTTTFAFHFGKENRYNALIGYRHMEIEAEETSGGIKVKTELTMSGPIAGLAFRF